MIKKINEIPIFKPKKSWRIAAKFKSYEEISERVIENIWGHQVTQPTAGIVSFEYKGNMYELESNIESGKLAVIFKDQSSGKQTYHGGRQVYLTDHGVGKHSLQSVNKKSVVSAVNVVDGGSGYENKKRTTQVAGINTCLLYTSPSPRDGLLSRMPSSA